MHRVHPSCHPDQLWKGKVVCRQYIQGFCSYGSRCKYDHPLIGEWLDPQPLPLCSPTSHSGEYWLSSYDGHHSDDSNGHSYHQYPASNGWFGDGMTSYCPKPLRPQHTANGCLDPKKIRSIIAWKTTPCKHFVKNNGWCPLGDACNFIHDWQLVYSTMWNKDIIRQTAGSSSRPDGNQKATSHCWAHVQGFCGARNCPHFHPADIQPYIKYTPCPAWILCDKRSTCPFKHFDAIPASQEPERVSAPAPVPPPPHVYYPPPPPPPVAYTPPAHIHTNPVEVSGTTYFPFTHDVAVADEYSYPVAGPPPVPAPMTAPVPLPLPAHLLADVPPPMTPPPSYHYVPQAYQHHVEHTALEPAYVNQPSLSQAPSGLPSMPVISPEDGEFIHSGPSSCHNPVPDAALVGVPVSKPEELVTGRISAESDPEDQRRKRRSNGHVRRISINIKTGEVVERALEGRHGVYGL